MHTCFSVLGYFRRPAPEPRVSYDDAAPVTGRCRGGGGHVEVEGTARHREAGDPVAPITTPVLDMGISACPPHPRRNKKQRKKGRRNEEKKSLESLDKAIILMQVGKRKRRGSNPGVVRRNPLGGRDMG